MAQEGDNNYYSINSQDDGSAVAALHLPSDNIGSSGQLGPVVKQPTGNVSTTSKLDHLPSDTTESAATENDNIASNNDRSVAPDDPLNTTSSAADVQNDESAAANIQPISQPSVTGGQHCGSVATTVSALQPEKEKTKTRTRILPDDDLESPGDSDSSADTVVQNTPTPRRSTRAASRAATLKIKSQTP